jgi:hypothetical protein
MLSLFGDKGYGQLRIEGRSRTVCSPQPFSEDPLSIRTRTHREKEERKIRAHYPSLDIEGYGLLSYLASAQDSDSHTKAAALWMVPGQQFQRLWLVLGPLQKVLDCFDVGEVTLPERQASVDRQHSAGHIRSSVADQKKGRISDLGFGAKTAHRQVLGD